MEASYVSVKEGTQVLGGFLFSIAGYVVSVWNFL